MSGGQARRVVVVHCHPDPESLVSAARDRALDGLAAAGHEVRLLDLYHEGFEPSMSADERRKHADPGVGADLQHHADALAWADALVFVYPTWWGSQPAMLTGWIDRVFVADVAWALPEGSAVLRPLLTAVRNIVVVTTHGSSKLVNTLQGEPGKRVMTRSIRLMCSRRVRTTWCALYGVDASGPADRTKFLAHVESTLASL